MTLEGRLGTLSEGVDSQLGGHESECFRTVSPLSCSTFALALVLKQPNQITTSTEWRRAASVRDTRVSLVSGSLDRTQVRKHR